MQSVEKKPVIKTASGQVHCPICTHSVPAEVEYVGKRIRVIAGQKCARCQSSLDAAALLYLRHAA